MAMSPGTTDGAIRDGPVEGFADVPVGCRAVQCGLSRGEAGNHRNAPDASTSQEAIVSITAR